MPGRRAVAGDRTVARAAGRGAGIRGAAAVHGADAARSRPAPGLLDLLAGRSGHRRVLPLAAAASRAQGRPRPADAALRERPVGAAADREAARAPAPADPDPLVRPALRARRPAALHDDSAGAGSGSGARHAALRRRPSSSPSRHQERRPGAVREGRRSASTGGRPHHEHARRDRGDRTAARGEAGPRRGDRQAGRRGLRRGQCRRRPPWAPPGRRGATTDQRSASRA